MPANLKSQIFTKPVCPLSKSDAPGVKKSGSKKIKGGLFQEEPIKPDRNGDQLPLKLYLSTGANISVRAPGNSWKCGICAIGGRTPLLREKWSGSVCKEVTA